MHFFSIYSNNVGPTTPYTPKKLVAFKREMVRANLAPRRLLRTPSKRVVRKPKIYSP